MLDMYFSVFVFAVCTCSVLSYRTDHPVYVGNGSFGYIMHDYSMTCVYYNDFGGIINCTVDVDTQWSLLPLRDGLEKTKLPLGDLTINITCLDGAKIFLPYPYQAPNIRNLYVKNCLIDGHDSEYGAEYKYPNTLRDLVFIDVTLIQDWKVQIDNYVNSPMQRVSVCGQEGTVYHVRRNISIFIPKTNVTLLEVAEAFEIFNENHNNSMYTCNYENMTYYEESYVNSLSINFFKILTDHNRYPKLAVFNFTYNNIAKLPIQLTQWHNHFPALREMDLSNNELHSFSFEHPDACMNQASVYINLANNNIRSVPDELPLYLGGETPLIINLLDNPIHCNCTTGPLVQYLKALLERHPDYAYLTKVKCHSPAERFGMEVLNVDL